MPDELFAMERAVLGAILADPEDCASVLDRLPAQEWTGPHQLIVEALVAMVDLGEPITPMLLMERMRKAGTLIRVGGGGILLGLVEARTSGGQSETEHLLGVLEGEALRRGGRSVAVRLSQRLDNPTVDPEDALERAAEEILQVGRPAAAVESLGWPEGDVEPNPDWVIPGLLAADERVMITGGEGLGKTMLIRQLVVAVAVGRHPWSFEEIEPAIALHVDLENPRSVTDRAYRRIRNKLRVERVELGDRLHRLEPRIWDATNPADVSWLLRAVRALKPRIIAIGPLKNMSSESLNDEDTAVKVTNVLNRIRAESNATLLLEAHAGHGSRGTDGDWRPRGSSSFLGWPEVGVGMRPVSLPPALRSAQLIPWRGYRTERYWPEHLVEGDVWPWVIDPRPF